MSFLDLLLDWANDCLDESDEAQEYLLSRGISQDQWKRHRIGYFGGPYEIDPSVDSRHNESCGDREKKSTWCDVCRYRWWSSTWEGEENSPKQQCVGKRLVDSIVFPLTSYSGVAVGFQIRSLVKKEYDTFAIRRRPEGYFFGTQAAIDSIWATREVTLVEGGPDHLVWERLISPNVLALTTSAVNKAQARFLRRFVKTVNLCLDLDLAGRQGVQSFIQYNADDFNIRNLKYPALRKGDKDLGDLWKRWGDEKFKKYFLSNYNWS